jgi:hypothetical protein
MRLIRGMVLRTGNETASRCTSEQACSVSYVHTKIPESLTSRSIRHRIIHVPEYYLPMKGTDFDSCTEPIPQRHGLP